MHAKPVLRVVLKWMIAGSGSVIADVITPYLMNVLSISSRMQTLPEWVGTEGEFWTLKIDGNVLTSLAQPFSASDAEIILRECEECHQCGRPEVLVRRHNDESVIWFAKTESDYDNLLGTGQYFLFNANEYERILDGSCSGLRPVSQDDFEHLLPWYTPHYPQEALYTEPELPRDKFGKRTLKIFADNFKFREFKTAATPDESRTLKIGLDRPDYPETAIRFGLVRDTMVFQFAQEPCIPVWMQFNNNQNPFADVFQIGELA